MSTTQFRFNPFTHKLDLVGSSSGPPPATGVSMRPYIVGPTNSDYTSIQDAIDAAVTAGASDVTPANILVKPNDGPYIEDITLADGIFVYANDTAGNNQWSGTRKSVILQGSVTLTSGTAKISGIDISPTSGSAIIMSGGELYISFCASYFFTGDIWLELPASGNASTIVMNNNSLVGTESPSQFISVASGQNLFLYDSNSAINFAEDVSTISGSGTVTWNSSGCYYVFQIDASNTDFNFVSENSTFNGNAASVPFLTSSVSTTGSLFLEHCNFIDFDVATDIITIGNANFIPGLQFCVFDDAYTYTLASGQVQHASIYMVDNGGPTDEAFVFSDAKTGYRDTRYIQKQAFVHTTDATTQTLLQIPLEEGESVIVQGLINGYADTHTQGQSQGGSFLILANRQSGGNVTADGSNVNNLVASTAAFAVFANTLNQSIDITVNAINLPVVPMSWSCTYQYMKMKDNT